MTPYQLLPALDAEQYDALRADIKAHGIRVPVDADENGQVLDGHHRSLIAAELGIDCPRRTVAGLTEAEKVAHAIAVNAHRRHLTQEQKRALLAESIKSEPEASDREHARRVGADHKTAGAVRSGLEGRGEVPHVAERRDSVGRQQPASKPRPQTSAPAASTPAGAERTSPPASGSADLTGERPPLDVATGAGSPVVDRCTGEINPGAVPIDEHSDYRHEPLVNPVAAARAEVAKQPAMLAGKAFDRLHTARLLLTEAGSAADIVADLVHDGLVDGDQGDDWLPELDQLLPLLTDLAAALRRRNLRSVSR